MVSDLSLNFDLCSLFFDLGSTLNAQRSLLIAQRSLRTKLIFYIFAKRFNSYLFCIIRKSIPELLIDN